MNTQGKHTRPPRDPAKPPVVLQVLPSLRSGGVERGTIEIARAIIAAGGRALVVSEGGQLTPSITTCGGLHIELPVASKNPFVMWSNIGKLRRIIREHGVDIVHARSRAPAWSAYFAAKREGVKFVTTFHGLYGLEHAWKKAYNRIMTKGDMVIAISHFIADHIKSQYGLHSDQIRVIQRGVDTRNFNPSRYSPQRMIDLSREWRLPEHLPLILFPGRITRWKGQDVFIRALASLPHRNFFAVILGDDKGHETFRKALEEQIVRAGLAGHVRIAKHTQAITEAYMLARVVVATSVLPEPFGRVVLEAQAMGKPVIACDQGGPMETVIAGATGWLVRPHSATQLAQMIDHALTLPEQELFDMSLACQKNAERFSLQKMCDQTLKVYAKLLGIHYDEHMELKEAV